MQPSMIIKFHPTNVSIEANEINFTAVKNNLNIDYNNGNKSIK